MYPVKYIKYLNFVTIKSIVINHLPNTMLIMKIHQKMVLFLWIFLLVELSVEILSTITHNNPVPKPVNRVRSVGKNHFP